MADKTHWNNAYEQRGASQVSWFRPHLQRSLDYIQRATSSPEAALIDVGGGASTLVDDLLAAQFQNITVLDLSTSALSVAQHRLGTRAQQVQWLEGDITEMILPGAYYDVWHDRAVFHFLTDPSTRAHYIANVRHALKPGGHLIIATFAPDGPEKCSGLPVARYDINALHTQFSDHFDLLDSCRETHQTPSGKGQSFVYGLFRMH